MAKKIYISDTPFFFSFRHIHISNLVLYSLPLIYLRLSNLLFNITVLCTIRLFLLHVLFEWRRCMHAAIAWSCFSSPVITADQRCLEHTGLKVYGDHTIVSPLPEVSCSIKKRPIVFVEGLDGWEEPCIQTSSPDSQFVFIYTFQTVHCDTLCSVWMLTDAVTERRPQRKKIKTTVLIYASRQITTTLKHLAVWLDIW